jgi:hypothetical protein
MQDVREGHWVLHQAARLAAEAARAQPKPVFLFSNTSRVFDPELDAILVEGGGRLVYGTDEAVRAAAAVLAQRRDGPVAPPPPPAAPDEATLALLGAAMDEAGAKRLLARYGLPVTREAACADIPAALRAAAEIGYPVALKILSPDISHKTEAGGVALGLATPEALEREAAAMLARVRAAAPGARLGLLVQEMVTGAVAEMILGVTEDPHAGPAVLCGLGGIHAEILDDVAVAIAPVRRSRRSPRCAACAAGRCWTGRAGGRRRMSGRWRPPWRRCRAPRMSCPAASGRSTSTRSRCCRRGGACACWTPSWSGQDDGGRIALRRGDRMGLGRAD